MNPSQPSRPGTTIKVVAMLLQGRWTNVLAMAIAQYLAAVTLFNDPAYWQTTLSDAKLHLIVFSVAFLVAGGYLINNFYDREKDIINRPRRTAIEGLVKKSTVLYSYFASTLAGAFLAFMVSPRAFLFFSGYAFLLWLYSHKVKKITLLGNLFATFLVVLPFFALLLYYQIADWSIVYFGFFFSWLLFFRESVKDIRYYKGDVVHDYQTVPVVMGMRKALRFLRGYAFTGILVSSFFWIFPFHLYIRLVALAAMISFALVLTSFSSQRTVRHARLTHTLFRSLLVISVLVLPFLRQ